MAVQFSQGGGDGTSQHEGPSLDSRSHPHREQGRDLQRLPESHTVHTPPAPTDPSGCLIHDTDTTHYHLLPRVFGLQKMAPQTRQSVPLP